MTSPPGHGQIGKIIEDMEEMLPSESIDRADYRGCRTTYGVLSMTYKRANDSNNPAREYKQLQDIEKSLRERLTNLDVTKGLPRKFQDPLDRLRNGVEDALGKGVTVDFLIQGMRDMLEEKPDATPAPKPEPVKMVSGARHKALVDALSAEREKNRKLNEENNRLAMLLKQYEMRERSGTGEALLKKQRR
ncbi:hypothetical protein PTNB85_03078 [Pyrenophora teres f. teres]|uniref:Uncharacterized protein n=1 Tax=Pyrenophora teres f. teres TaxID=97479 RepID=A0A6S6W9Q9_9PLEO|nr:hypothetical protein HRS9139_03231 [Pyrenophora teres f. teres]KAE8844813.1 hypothetical protein PTNB85_03078 [Pyrenophora teres f. teres]KAE8846985.1 hypothetical protein HRS9122_03892 [Pyrenophora teres f. teres]KAE8866039.1 hypothetical protein PTNB29_03186 [Pyrenophora teres f. teres]CAE7177171.1 hypothetical protein PTTW11_06125 [Pyrenophora teres f. teres]